MSSGNPIKDYKKLSKALTGQTEPRESKLDKQNRLNRESNLAAAAEKKRRAEAARIGEKLGAKAGIRKDIRDSHTKMYR
jgi:hypothetical protein